MLGPVDIPDIVQKVSPSIVNVECSRSVSDPFYGDPFFRQFFGDLNPNVENSIGTGFVISADGHIATNQHVIDGADEIMVNFNDGNKLKAEVVGQDYEMDLAILKIASKEKMVPLTLGNSEQLRVGEWVIAIGNPYGLDHTVTAGLVSAKGRPMQIEKRIYKDLIQTDAAINPGNSGGPLLNTKGEVVGINTAVNAQAQGIGFAISINTARDILDDLISNGKIIRPYIGIGLQPVDTNIAEYLKVENKGIVVVAVEPRSPAEKAGLAKYDVITTINKKAVNNYDDVQDILKDQKVGDTIVLEVYREAQPMIVSLKLAEKP
ncbi:MAG: PDZ domain-containing protein [Syntrophomonadaceae bacterium]|nr:PDZ domain-containing protein [Syntrophomonadaceae bacterium]